MHVPETERQPSGAAPSLSERYAATRHLSEALAGPLSEADATLQSMADASPAKWHLAHTTWFFETFLLRDRLAGYRLYDERWPFLFDSYYEAEGERTMRCSACSTIRHMSRWSSSAWRTSSSIRNCC